ncbi:MAG: hypothetical protein QXL88_02325 [Candidatus Pacearchaeota archaeon]
MPKKKNWLGAWAFLIGVILAVVFGLFAFQTLIAWILLIFGIIIGLLNIADEEAQPFLIAGVILVIVAYFGGFAFSAEVLGIDLLENILRNMLLLFVPATVIVALKSVFSIAKT